MVVMRGNWFGPAPLALAICLVIALAPNTTALAQAPAEERTPSAEASIKARMNQWTVGLAAGLPDGGFVRFASEMARTMDDGDNMRILPIVTRGPLPTAPGSKPERLGLLDLVAGGVEPGGPNTPRS